MNKNERLNQLKIEHFIKKSPDLLSKLDEDGLGAIHLVWVLWDTMSTETMDKIVSIILSTISIPIKEPFTYRIYCQNLL